MTSPQLRALPKTCSVEGCERRYEAKGWCAMHYQRWRRGSPMEGSAREAPSGCSVEDCNGPHYARGWCDFHYRRARRYGDPLHDTAQTLPNPWLRFAPECPRCETNALVLLFSATDPSRRWYCLPCDRFVGRSSSPGWTQRVEEQAADAVSAQTASAADHFSEEEA